MDERERLIEIMKVHSVVAKQLAEQLHVSAGTISNILSGRNKPSHDFLKAVAKLYPRISRDWLFMGEGEMYVAGYEPTIASNEPDLFTAIVDDNPTPAPSACKPATQSALSTTGQESLQRTVSKILIFYSDGTYEER